MVVSARHLCARKRVGSFVVLTIDVDYRVEAVAIVQTLTQCSKVECVEKVSLLALE